MRITEHRPDWRSLARSGGEQLGPAAYNRRVPRDQTLAWRPRVALVSLATVAAASVFFMAVASAAPAACGSATSTTLASVDATVLNEIYANELSGGEVTRDLAQVINSSALITSVIDGNRTAALAAVKRIVYHHGWHIVRLRVFGGAGRLLADFGGPYVIAPVAGILRSSTGDVVGSFLMSVQDDVGVTKLETRTVGDPIGIYVKRQLVAHLGAARLPATTPNGSSVRIGHATYDVVRETYDAFPTGTLQAVLFIRPPALALRATSCAGVRAGEFGRIARHLVTLLGSQDLHGYAYWIRVYTGAQVFVRDANGAQLTSSPVPDAGPPVLPAGGIVSYQGASWLVYSFQIAPATLVYMLVAPS
jgi:hypothetical protein